MKESPIVYIGGAFVAVITLVVIAVKLSGYDPVDKSREKTRQLVYAAEAAKERRVASPVDTPEPPEVEKDGCWDVLDSVVRVTGDLETANQFTKYCEEQGWPVEFTDCFREATTEADLAACGESALATMDAALATTGSPTPEKRELFAKSVGKSTKRMAVAKGRKSQTFRFVEAGCSREVLERLDSAFVSLLGAMEFTLLECHNGDRVVASRKL